MTVIPAFGLFQCTLHESALEGHFATYLFYSMYLSTRHKQVAVGS